MAKDDSTDDKNIPAPRDTELPVKRAESKVLSGAKALADGTKHVGIAVQVTSGAGLANLMIPDVTKVKDGSPVFVYCYDIYIY